jgi:hypothetical protein
MTAPPDTDLSYARQPYTAAPTVFTYRDLLDRLLLFSNAGPTAQNQPEFRVAIEEAYREIVYARKWRYLLKQLEIAPVGPQSTGTIQYDSASRICTLTGATWPSWTLYGHLMVNWTFFQVEQVIDANNIVLDLRANPGADLPALTAYQLYRSVYTLPPDWRAMHAIENQAIRWTALYVEPIEWYRRERHTPVGSVPSMWTVMADPRLVGSMSVYLWPYPSNNLQFGTLYLAKARDLRVNGYSTADYTGTVSISGATVTGSGTSFGQQHVGAFFRVSNIATNADNTTACPDGAGGTNPYSEQAVVKTVATATSLVLDRSPTGTYSAKPYCISDPVDVPEWMLPAILARARLRYIANRPATAASMQMYADLDRLAFQKACECDQVLLKGPTGPYYVDRLQRDVPVGGN